MAAHGFFTDITVCIGCKACETACKQWNQLPDDGFVFTGRSYDNTGDLGTSTWRHVCFIERATGEPRHGSGAFTWLLMSDVCKHCRRAGCLENCPTGAIIRTEFDTVYVQPDVCNGCGYCVVGCPFGVIDRRGDDGRAWKCTLCYDRQRGGLEPACAKACPTDSITFGPVDELRRMARERLEVVRRQGVADAFLYGIDEDDQPGTEGLNAFFLLTGDPALYNLPEQPVVPTKTAGVAWAALGAAGIGLAALAVGAVLAGKGGDE